MVSITGTDYQVHELRNISPAFRRALEVWQKDAPEDKIFCALHGVMEPVSLYVPETIAYKADRVEREQALCGALEAEDRQRIERDMEAGRTRRMCGRAHQ